MRRLGSLFNDEPELRPILSKVSMLTHLQQHFARAVPPYLAESSQVTALLSGILHVCAANNTVAAKLRQLAPSVATSLKNSGCEVSGIQVRVQVTYPVPPRKHAPRILSAEARRALSEFSATLEDSNLKQSLTKMLKKP